MAASLWMSVKNQTVWRELFCFVLCVGLCETISVKQRQRGETAKHTCAEEWQAVHRGCYQFIQDALGWQDAQEYCQERGGELLSVSDVGEKNGLVKKLKSLDRKKTWWVGVKMNRALYQWVWLDGGDFSFRITAWKRGEPNDEGGLENCAEIDFRGQLNDKVCDALRSFICEREDNTKRTTPSEGSKSASPVITTTTPPTTTTTSTTTTRPTTTTTLTINAGREYDFSDPCGGTEWQAVHRGCYQFIQDALGWQEAQEYCQERGGELLSVSDVGEKIYLVKKLKSLDRKKTWWLGVKMNRALYQWEWLDGGDFNPRITKWKKGEPNDEGGLENCAVIDFRGQLNDKECDALRSFVCERQDKTKRTRPIPTEGSKSDPPVIGGRDLNTTVISGSNFTIPCLISDPPSFTSVTWHKDGVALTSGGRYVGGTEASPDLIILHLVQADTGVYRCSATNTGGTVTGPSNAILVPYMCPYTEVNDPISQNTYTVPETELGKAYRSPDICLSNGEPYVSLQCRGEGPHGAAWATFTPNQACNFSASPTSSITHTLKNISQSVISEETATDVVNKTGDILAEMDDPVGVDIVHVVDIVQQIAGQDNISQETGQGILELVDTITKVNRTVLLESNTIGNATNRLITAIEEIGDRIVFNNDTQVVRLVSSKTAVEIWDLSEVTGDVVVGLEMLQGGQSQPTLARDDLVSLSQDRSPTYNGTEAAIFLPASFVRDVVNANPAKGARLTLFVFADSTLFRPGRLENPESGSQNTDAVLNSKVVSATITGGGVKVTDLRGHVVTTVFSPEVQDESLHAKTLCVFWNPAGSTGQGSWSQDGCHYHSTRQGRVVCACDHLTNFAILMDPYGQDSMPGATHQTALSVITVTGLSLSIAGLSVTVLSFLLIKKQRQGRQGRQGQQQTLFQMALAMLGSWSVLLAGFTRTESPGSCVAVAALLHYLILASFMWMLVEGLLQYLLFVKVFGVSLRNFVVRATMVAWGLPLIPVVTVLAIDHNLYRGGDKYCWMSLTPLYFAFLAPMAVIMLINIVVYVLVIYNICRSGVSGTKNRTVGVRASFACFFALGLSWVFAFFAVSDARLVFQYLFTLTSTPQGFLVFLIFTARDPSVRAYWARLCCGGCRQVGKPDTALTSGSKGSQGPVTRGGGGGGGGSEETALRSGSKSDSVGHFK